MTNRLQNCTLSQVSQTYITCSFLLSSSICFLALTGYHLAQHHNSIAIHERNPGKTLTILEGVAYQWLLRHETALSHFVGFQGMRFFHLFSSSLLPHLPFE